MSNERTMRVFVLAILFFDVTAYPLSIGATPLSHSSTAPKSLVRSSFSGRVESIDVPSNRVQVTDDSGHRLQLTLNSSTQILKDERPATLAELKPQDPVVVRYWVDATPHE
jgi:hypothetical protein